MRTEKAGFLGKPFKNCMFWYGIEILWVSSGFSILVHSHIFLIRFKGEFCLINLPQWVSPKTMFPASNMRSGQYSLATSIS